MLTGTGLGDDALRAESFREQRLADRVVDLVRAGMREIFSLQPDVGAPAAAEFARIGQRGRPADPVAEFLPEISLELVHYQV